MKNGQVLEDQAVVLEAGGRKHKVRLCLWGLIVAEEEHGYDIGGLDLDREGAEKRSGVMRQMAELLWIGVLAYEPELTLQEFATSIGFSDIQALTEAFNKVVALQLTDDVKEAASTKKKSGRKT